MIKSKLNIVLCSFFVAGLLSLNTYATTQFFEKDESGLKFSLNSQSGASPSTGFSGSMVWNGGAALDIVVNKASQGNVSVVSMGAAADFALLKQTITFPVELEMTVYGSIDSISVSGSSSGSASDFQAGLDLTLSHAMPLSKEGTVIVGAGAFLGRTYLINSSLFFGNVTTTSSSISGTHVDLAYQHRFDQGFSLLGTVGQSFNSLNSGSSTAVSLSFIKY